MNKETLLPRTHEALQILDTIIDAEEKYHRLCGIGDSHCNGDVFVFDGESFQCQKCGEKFIPHPCELEDWTYLYVPTTKN